MYMAFSGWCVLVISPRTLAEALGYIFGQAAIAFTAQKYSEALKFYRSALQVEPYGKPDVRVPIAVCLFKLRRIDAARRALLRALEVVG